VKARGIIILIVVLIVVAGYFFLIEEKQRRAADLNRLSSRMLLPYGPLDIDAVSFINPFGETIMWERDGDGWLITYPVTDIGEKSTIDMFLGQIAPGQKLEEYTGVTDLAQYGLSPPYATVILESRRYGRTDTVNVGDKTPTSFRAYASLGSSSNVVVTRELAHNVMQKRLFHLRDKNFLPPADRNITGFSLITPNRDLSFQRSGDSWKVTGSTLTVDRNVIEPWVSGLSEALVYEFTAENLADTLSFGIGDPCRAAVLRTAGGDSIRVSFGRDMEGMVPVVRTGRPKVTMIDAGFLDAFHWTDDRLIVMSLSIVSPGLVTALQCETPDSVASWKLVDGVWTSGSGDAAPVDQEAMKYLLMLLRSTAFESVVTDRDLVSAARPDLIITLGGSSGDVLDIISLFRFKDGTPGGISISGGNAGRLSEGTVAEIHRACSAISSR
jgi:hypothetical protein